MMNTAAVPVRKPHRNTVDCRVDHLNGKIVMTRKFASAANIFGTPEYKHFCAIRRDNPAYEVSVRKNKQPSDRVSFKGLNYPLMEKHIRVRFTEESPEYKEYQRQKNLSEAYKNPFMYMREWFRKTYPDWNQYPETASENKASA